MSDLSAPHSYLHEHYNVPERPPRDARFRWLKSLVGRCLAHFTSSQNAFNSNVVRSFDMLHHRLDVLDERIGSVARESVAAHETARQVLANIAGHDTALSNLTSAINSTRDAQDHQSSVIGSVQEAAALLARSVEGIQKEFETIVARIAELAGMTQTRIDDINRQQVDINQRQADINQREVDINKRQDDLVRGLEQASSSFFDATQRQNRIVEDAAAIADRVARAEQGFVELRALVDRLGASVGLLTSSVAEAALPAQRGKATAQSPAAHVASAAHDVAYEAFEDAQRGSEEDVKSRLGHYVALLAQVPRPHGHRVLDVGCGRGEFLELLKAASIAAYGVDANAAAAARAKAKGLDVHHADLFDELRKARRGSIAALSAFHVVEHLQHQQLAELIALAATRLQEGGLVIIETPNALNLTVAACEFYKDPTHVRPVHPVLLSHMLTSAGFTGIEVSFLNPFPEDHRLVLAHNALTEVVRGNFKKIDHALFGCRDCAVTATIRTTS